MLKKVSLIAVMITVFFAWSFAQEQVTITTYYPSPYGSYRELSVSERQAIGDTNGDGRTDVVDMAVDSVGNPISGSLTLSGSVGIGTTAPRERLHLKGTTADTSRVQIQGVNPDLEFYEDTVGTAFRLGLSDLRRQLEIQVDDNGDGQFTSVSGLFVITESGRVGIGTTTPVADVDVVGDLVMGGTTESGGETIRLAHIDNYFGAGNKEAFFIEKTDDDTTVEGGMVLGFATSAGTNIVRTSPQWAVNHVPVIVMRGSGDVGIGTTDPQAKLDVDGGVQIGTDNAACNAAKAGTMRYNSGAIQYCDGSAWKEPGSGGGGFGARTYHSFSTVYHAATDGIVTAFGRDAHSDPGLWIIGLVGNSSPPNVRVAVDSADRNSNVDWACITFPVRKGEYWRVTRNASLESGSGRIVWVPSGS